MSGGLLDIVSEAYMRNVGRPFAQLAGGGVRGLLGLDPPEYANALGMEAYRNALAFGNAPTPLAFAALPAAAAKGLKGAKAARAAASVDDVEAARKNAVGAFGLPEANTAADRAAALGLERGWYRGGPEIADGRRSGPWYTRDTSDATGYAQRFPTGEVREYAIPACGYFEASGRYGPRLPNDLAKILDDPYYGPKGAELAKWFRTYVDEGILGGSVWQALESRFGNDGAAEIISKLGAFNGVKGITGGDEALVFKSSMVRDANKAAFDPAKRAVDDIYGAATLPVLGLLGGASLGASYLLNRQNSDQAPSGKK